MFSLLILLLLYYWFAIADRYAIFLYGHSTTGIPRADPFDEMTSSRYWMSGLVASGAVMVLYMALNWAGGRLAALRKKEWETPEWWQVWSLCTLPLCIGIPLITMTVNAPTMPPALAAACVIATLAGLAVALLPGRWAAERPRDLVWLVLDGVGLMPTLLLMRAIELPARGVSLSTTAAWMVALGSIAGGLVWFAGTSLLRRWRGRKTPSAAALLMAGIGMSYVLMPLVHYIFATPPEYKYITTASNFFAFDWRLQAVVVAAAVIMAVGVTRARQRLSASNG